VPRPNQLRQRLPMPWMRSASARADGNSVRYRHADGRYDHRVRPITVQLQEETSLAEFQWCGAFLVVVGHMVDSGAYGIEGDQPGIVGLQHFGCRAGILHARIKPQVVAPGLRMTGIRSWMATVTALALLSESSTSPWLSRCVLPFSPIFPQTRFIDSYSSVQASKEKHQARIVAE